MLPVMICLDGFVLSHTVERVEVPDQAAVDAFLPKFVPVNVLDPDDPVVMNPICPPEYATEMRYQLDRAIDSAKKVISEIGIDFAKRFGRSYGGLLDAEPRAVMQRLQQTLAFRNPPLVSLHALQPRTP